MGRRGYVQTRHAEHRGPLADGVLLAARGRLPRGEETMEYTVSMKVDGRVDVTMENYNG